MPDLPRLSTAWVLASQRADDGLERPPAGVFDLPEKVLQFGSGRFLRAFADFFIDAANRQGRFGGRVVVVQSTGAGRSDSLDAQDGLYTLCVQGLVDGMPSTTYRVLAAVSRAVAAGEAWGDVLACARNPALEVVVSNTTEVGIQLDEADRPDLDPPRSFPGKLTAVLYERFRAFDGDAEKGVVVLPCELIEDNGDQLAGIVLTLADRWGLGEAFTAWVRTANRFCNTLVDRIVTGKPSPEKQAQHEARLGYRDALLAEAEPYRLWAIEGDAALRARLGFAAADPGIVVAEDISPYRERKVRILNGTHTIMVPLAFLYGHDTVLQAMEDAHTGAFVREVMREEIVPSLDVDAASARQFADEVLERFRNPFIEHLLINITFQATTKMRHRVVPSLLAHYRKQGVPPRRILLGFAAYLLFMRGVEVREGTVYGQRAGVSYPINDDHAGFFMEAWGAVEDGDDVDALVRRVGARADLWGTDLTQLPGFADAVADPLRRMLQRGVPAAVEPSGDER
jgi:tagaturonate reductase